MKISNMRVGTRLSVGFFLVLFMMFIMGMMSWQLTQSNNTSVNTMIYQDLQKERLVQEWITLVDRNSGNTIAAMATQDPKLREQILNNIKNDTARTSEVQSTLQPLLRFEKGKAFFRAIQETRGKYLVLRKEGLEMAEQGKYENMSEFISTRFMPVTQEYNKTLHSLLELQNEIINDTHASIKKASHLTELVIVLSVLFGIVLGSLIAWYITRSITRPLKEAVTVATRAAQGDLTTVVNVHSTDELGQLMSALKEMVSELGSTVLKVKHGAESISVAADQIDAGNQDLASRTEEQAAGVVETAATLEQLTSTIKSTADNVRRVNELFTETGQVVKINSDRMHEVSAAMEAIHKGAEKMGDIIAVIEGIAFQTNILALNAAVEAARAGEQGRGFAVVAGEVRTLAQRSSASAKEIRDIISASVSKIADGRGLVSQADNGMQEIVDTVSSVHTLVDEIARASHEQSEGITQINITMGQIDTTTQQNASLVEESSAASGSLKEQARILIESIRVFVLRDSEMNNPPLRPQVSPAVIKGKSIEPRGSEKDWQAF